jgi:hypothetical protein
MWIPRSPDELVAALADGTLRHESAAYEYKAELPDPRSNSDIAVDVAAMATDGGIIIYGVREDKVAVTFSPEPIPLEGVIDRISNVVTANVRETVGFTVTPLPLNTDHKLGYVIVDVPASIRAPHMVESKGEYRFYGRVPGGNKRLTEAEIARLYQRREQVERAAYAALDGAVAIAPLPARPGIRGDIHLVARPLLSDSTLRQRVLPDNDNVGLSQRALRARNSLRFQTDWAPDFSDIVSGGQVRLSLEGMELFNPPIERDGTTNDTWVARLEVLDDGTTRYFHAAIATWENASGSLLIREAAVAQITAHFVLFAGRVLNDGDYHGPVEASIAIMGAKGAESVQIEHWMSALTTPPRFATDDYRNSIRVPAEAMINQPVELARQLVDRLLRTLRANGSLDPLAPSTG